jgi:hypothetical protein
MSADLDRLLRAMAAKEEPIPKGFTTTRDYAAQWGKSSDWASDVLRRAAENGLAERRQVSRRCGGKTVKIWVYRIT